MRLLAPYWRLLALLPVLLVSSWATAASKTGVSLEFILSDPTVQFTFGDGTKSEYSGVSGLTQFQAPFYEKGSFKFGGTFSYRYMEVKNTGIADTQFGSHTGFGAGLQVNYGFLLLGANTQMMTAKDFLSGSNATHTTFDYNITSLYAGLIWQFGALGIGGVYTNGQATLSPSTFTKNTEAKMNEQMIGVRLNYNFNVGSIKFFTKLFSR